MTKKDVEINRLTVYVTLMPRQYSTDENTKKKIEAYKNGDTCSHWANRCVVKRFPWGFQKQHLAKNLNKLQPLLVDGNIPEYRKKLL